MSSINTSFIKKKGRPFPLGSTPDKNGFNFSILATNVEKLILVVCVSGSDHKPTEFVLERRLNRTGDIWHVYIETDLTELIYGYKVIRRSKDDNMVIIDPYAKQLKARQWGDPSSYGEAACCIAQKVTPEKELGKVGCSPETPLKESIIYELHTRGFTRNENSQTRFKGSFRAIIEKIPYLKSLGITAVELLPITAFDENDNRFFHPETGERHKNFWGYNPVSFFAVHPPYGVENATTEFKELVHSLHENGIEIILDMVFNHTGEGDTEGTSTSFRILADEIYYLHDKDGEYLNYSGCGNTFNTNHPVVQDLIIDSLRFWTVEMGVDGFRFDLASIFNRDQTGAVTADSPILDRINNDPVLKEVKLIAEAWDASGLYQVGSFSTDPRWLEWNGKYRDDVRKFLGGFSNSIQNLATRIAGSSDLYQNKSPLNSINFLTSHDGFTLYDLMSYEKKHNHLNGEENRDGDNHHFSWNSGLEGDPTEEISRDIRRLRMQRMRTAIVVLLLSQGIPMITAGDEFARTQSGNNNCWCQDTKTSWLDWNLLEENKGMFEFVRYCISLRKNHALFQRDIFFDTDSPDTRQEISWQDLAPGKQNWSSDSHALAFHLRSNNTTDEFFIILNGNREKSLDFVLPQVKSSKWAKLVDTATEQYSQENDQQSIALAGTEMRVEAMTAIVLKNTDA